MKWPTKPPEVRDRRLFVWLDAVDFKFVMPGLVPGIHVFKSIKSKKTWMAGTTPGHDDKTVGRMSGATY
jgi:hypothetical protein